MTRQRFRKNKRSFGVTASIWTDLTPIRDLNAGTRLEPMMPEFIFDREEERERIHRFLVKRRPFLIYGPSGVGKTLLLRSVLPEFRSVLYCDDSATTSVVFRSLARSLLRLQSPRAAQAFRDEDAIATRSAVSLKGIVMDALREGEYSIVLDHLKRPSYSFASAVREVMGWGSTPVSAVARSSHMEDTGFLQPIYGDRSQKCEVCNFDDSTAEQFARERINRSGLSGTNISEFLEKVLEFSGGNPGAIIAMIDMATCPKYRSEEHIKISPLYIDFRMNGGVAR
jgi:Cdc6-like AAA superfamily ATPase